MNVNLILFQLVSDKKLYCYNAGGEEDMPL